MQTIFIDNSHQSGIRGILFFSFFAVLSLLFFISCAERSPYKYHNTYALVEPVVHKNGIKQPPNYYREFEDDKILIKFTIKDKKIFFRLKNKTDKELTILWDRLNFVDTKGVSHKVVGFDNLFTEKQDKQPLQRINAKREINNLIVPLENIEFIEEWTWYVRPLFNRTDDLALRNRGKTFSISMPIEIDGETINYQYKFRIENIVPL
ncbi:MAG: hypothetical protein AABZ11_11655 [Nitrospinota bacterium]